ncbi:MAG: hypothetical protein WC592_06915 [Candidatus Omnitrophota bacterium]
MLLRKAAVLLALLFFASGSDASDGKDWYPFLENKGWYSSQGGSGASSSATTPSKSSDGSAAQPTTQSTFTSPMTATNTTNQPDGQQKKSDWFK